jgi:hypothetical protein
LRPCRIEFRRSFYDALSWPSANRTYFERAREDDATFHKLIWKRRKMLSGVSTESNIPNIPGSGAVAKPFGIPKSVIIIIE